MQNPANLDLFADRGLIFDEEIAFFGQDFTSGSFRMQVRQVPDASGSPIISLTTTVSTTAAGVRLVYGGSDTLPNHVAADRISQFQADAAKAANGYSDTDLVPLSLLSIRILAATMDLATYPADETGDPLSLAYDLLVTPFGGDETKYAYGAFVVRGTVTQ